MAIQVRRGQKKDFNPDKMLPGEWAGTTDTKEVFFTFAPGDTKKMATYEDMEENIREATGEITAGLTEGISTAIQHANTAADMANQAAETAQASITDLTEDVTVAIENSNVATKTATQAAKDAQDAAQEAREAAGGIGSVTGVKGDKETEYRQGNINLTPENLGALSTTGDAGANTVTFTSNDSGPDGDPAVLEVEKLTSGETLFSILQKASRIFTNFRYLLRLAGTTDISAISDGTITGALTELNNSFKSNTFDTLINITETIKNGETYTFPVDGYLHVESPKDTYVQLRINGVMTYMLLSSNPMYEVKDNLYVKKGMNVKYENGTINRITFYPFKNT